MTANQTPTTLEFPQVIAEICDLNWANLTPEQSIDTAWAYYFFSIQFRENLQTACALFPDDSSLRHLEREECNTDNLSPWDGVAVAGEKLNHDEFMRRLLHLSPIPEDRQFRFEANGRRYLDEVRSIDADARARSISSYEDGGLEQVFRAMLHMPESDDPALNAFRHFLSEHIRFDSDPDQGHGALSRHLRADDRILPLWTAFLHLLVECVPELDQKTHRQLSERALEHVSYK
jgi:hypothetical protein